MAIRAGRGSATGEKRRLEHSVWGQRGDVPWYDWKTLRLFGPLVAVVTGSTGSFRPALSYPGLIAGCGPGMLVLSESEIG